MPIRSRLTRLTIGVLAIIITLFIAFAILMPMAHRWGATNTEIASKLPGDELVKNPVVLWNNAVTINAPPEKVWPWIIQIGDTRGGFYSYTFIENALAGKQLYHNADHIMPEYQNPPMGQEIIGGTLSIMDYKLGQYMLANSTNPDLGWSWVWSISPAENGQTQLLIRCRIEPYMGGSNPVMTFLMDMGGFAMEQNMLQGIKLRAEGSGEPVYTETLEIALWLAALLIGLAAGIVFLFKKAGGKALLVGILAVLALPVFLIVQPPVGVRILIDVILLAGLIWAGWPEKKPADRARSGERLPVT